MAVPGPVFPTHRGRGKGTRYSARLIGVCSAVGTFRDQPTHQAAAREQGMLVQSLCAGKGARGEGGRSRASLDTRIATTCSRRPSPMGVEGTISRPLPSGAAGESWSANHAARTILVGGGGGSTSAPSERNMRGEEAARMWSCEG